MGIDKGIVLDARPPLSRRAVVEHLADHDATLADVLEPGAEVLQWT